MSAAAIFKITKIAISPQRFDRYLRNLLRWCRMVLLAVQTVKNWISKIQAGRQLKTVKSLQPFDRFWLNLARWRMLVSRARRQVEILIFMHLVANLCHRANRTKNCFNIHWNYIMRKYAILTIKQQISHARTVVRECCKVDDESQNLCR